MYCLCETSRSKSISRKQAGSKELQKKNPGLVGWVAQTISPVIRSEAMQPLYCPWMVTRISQATVNPFPPETHLGPEFEAHKKTAIAFTLKRHSITRRWPSPTTAATGWLHWLTAEGGWLIWAEHLFKPIDCHPAQCPETRLSHTPGWCHPKWAIFPPNLNKSCLVANT